MRTRAVLIALAVVAAGSAAHAGQHDAKQPAGSVQLPAEATQCALAQLSVTRIIEVAMARLETARQSNSASAMRAAVDDLQSALREIRAQLAPCAPMAAADPHAGHVMPSVPPAPAGAPGTPATKPGSPAPGAATPPE